MTVTFGFYNSLNGDRQYDSRDVSKLFDGLIADGVFATVGEGMLVEEVTGTGMGVKVLPGRAWFNHTWTLNDSDMILNIDPSDLVFNRIDLVVIEVNAEPSVRQNSIKIVKGTHTENPTPPDLIKSELVNQYALAEVYVGAGVNDITQANITNKVGTAETPLVTGIIDTIGSEGLIIGWQADYDAWKTARQTQFDTWMNNEISEFNTWKATIQGDHEDWILAQETAFTNWINTKQTEFNNWMAAQDTLFTDWMTSEQTDFTAWRNLQQSTFDTWFADIQAELDGIDAAQLTTRVVALEDAIADKTATGVLSTTEKTNLVTAINELFQSVSDGKSTIATAIADMNQTASGSDTFLALANAIRDISNDANAQGYQILSGQTAYVNGVKVTGTMPNRGTVNQSLGVNGSYTIPSGYHSGSGVVSQSIATKGAQTFTPGTTNQTIASGRYLTGAQTILGDADLISANIKGGKNIFGVQGEASVVDTDDANAVAGNIYPGKTAYVNGAKLTGSMAILSGDYVSDNTRSSGTTIYLGVPTAGYYSDNADIKATDPDFLPENIREGVNLFGKVGTVKEGIQYEEKLLGSTPMLGQGVEDTQIVTMSFAPKMVVVHYANYYADEGALAVWSEIVIDNGSSSNVGVIYNRLNDAEYGETLNVACRIYRTSDPSKKEFQIQFENLTSYDKSARFIRLEAYGWGDLTPS